MAEKDALILSLLPLVGQLQAALARIAELEARLALLEKPPKTPDNSSLPPSKGQKTSPPPEGRKPPRKSHAEQLITRIEPSPYGGYRVRSVPAEFMIDSMVDMGISSPGHARLVAALTPL